MPVTAGVWIRISEHQTWSSFPSLDFSTCPPASIRGKHIYAPLNYSTNVSTILTRQSYLQQPWGRNKSRASQPSCQLKPSSREGRGRAKKIEAPMQRKEKRNEKFKRKKYWKQQKKKKTRDKDQTAVQPFSHIRASHLALAVRERADGVPGRASGEKLSFASSR